MIKGQSIKVRDDIDRPVVNYRAINALNCSMIKLFDKDPVKFYEQFKLGKTRKEEKSTALIIGDLVDFYILDCKGDEQEFENRFDEKFALFEESKGTGQVFVLADILYKIAKSNTNEEGVITAEFSDMFAQAAEKVRALGKYSKKTDDKILEDFNKNGSTYYQTLIDNTGKTVVEVSLLDKARIVARNLIEDPFTKDLFTDSEHIEYFPKFPVEWIYRCADGTEIICKSEIDVLRIDHKKKIIYVKDLKTTYDNENFEMTYLKHRYDLQAAFYHIAIKSWAQTENMTEYSIIPMEFIVGDTSANNRRPIRYRLSILDLKNAMGGFYLNGVRYKGINQIIEEIHWAEQNNIWNASKEVIDNHGIMRINLKYENDN